MDEVGEPDTGRAGQVDTSTLPEIVTDLWEAMLRLDPSWDLADWLSERAREELELAGTRLDAERCRAEQRLHRIELLEQRVARLRGGEAISPRDPRQRNLFESYSNTVDAPVQAPPSEVEYDDAIIEAGVNFEEVEDDPLLAIVREHVLQYLEECADEAVAIEELLQQVCQNGITAPELHEAIECLIKQRNIIEIDEGVFMLTD
jgi:DNA replicative helicase MCM subunit Mcm2 (Cdc46/Mcm family)